MLKTTAIASIVKGHRLMEWKIKARPHPTFTIDVALGSMILIALCVHLWIIFLMDESVARDFFKTGFIIFPLGFIFFWWIARKKTVWNYTISTEGGFVEFWEDYFQGTKYFFRGLAVFAIVCVLAMMVIAPDLIWAVAGIGGMVILAGVRLMTWENEVEWQRFTWDRPQRISTDRKRGLVLLQRKYDPELPFWENYMYVRVFLPKGQIDEFLALCKKYAPSDVEYEEGVLR